MDAIEDLWKRLAAMKAERALVSDAIAALEKMALDRGTPYLLMKKLLVLRGKSELNTSRKPNGRAESETD